MISIFTFLFLFSIVLSIKMKLSDDTKCCLVDHTITISGFASVYLPSDLIKIRVAMETKENLASNSLKKNTDISRAVDKAIKELGIKSSDISTTSFSIFDSFKSVLQADKVTYLDVFDGYKVVNEIEIRVKELSFVGKIIDRVVNAGATSITGITFTNDDALIQKTKKELLVQASNDATEKANLILGANKMKIKDILKIENTDSSSSQLDLASGVSQQMNLNNNNSVQPVYGSANSISANVSVTFIIENF
jgi:uncharacterized protein YggE